MKIALYGERLEKENVLYLKLLLDYAKNNFIETYIEKNFFQILKVFDEFKDLGDTFIFSSYKELSTEFKFLFSFGGDGTILSALAFVRELKIPIIGINTGNLGFLATFNKKKFAQNIKKIFQDKLYFSERILIKVATDSKKELTKFNFALNEIAILRKETVSMITIEVYIDKEFLASYRADGLIVSTPSGSTGYSLSCGGPIITPDSKSFVITPIAPHNLFSRPLVIPDEKKIHLKIQSRANLYSLSLDNRLETLPIETEINIEKANFVACIVEDKNQTYFKTLREKLLWGADIRN